MKLRHPESKQTLDVRDDFVEMYLSQGWQPAEKKAVPKGGDAKGK